MLNLILFGPPGCGKGTQSSRVACRYNLVHISTGELFRREVARQTSLGIHMADYMNKGLLVPDAIVLKKLYQSTFQLINSPGVVFDGFPRTIFQASVLDRFLKKRGMSVHIVFFMMVDEEELFHRMMGRAEDSGRSDDNERTIRHRMEVYREHTRPLKEYYQRQNIIAKINGMAPVKEVSDRIANVVEHYRQKKEIILQM
jgi:adenylate kinase